MIQVKFILLEEAFEFLKEIPNAKFKKTKESVDVAVNLGVDPRKSDQVVRGAMYYQMAQAVKYALLYLHKGKMQSLQRSRCR